MEAFYWAPPSADTLAKSGMQREDFQPPPPVELWPDSAAAFSLFARNHTQWRVGPTGVVGLDYLVFFRELEGRSRQEQDETMDVIRLIEAIALEHIHKS